MTSVELDYWPQAAWEAAVAIFGAPLHNRESRTYKALDRRIGHCRRVWAEKFGPLNAEQEEYAGAVLASALRVAARDAGSDRKLLWPYAQAGIGRMVNHEDVYAGFRRRQQLVDVTDTLKALA